ncbi:MAG: hypothetical protein ACLRR3_03960 [Eubacterium sp.]
MEAPVALMEMENVRILKRHRATITIGRLIVRLPTLRRQ